MSDAFFTNMNSQSLSELMSGAGSSILYAAPGIHEKPARALIDASVRLGADLVMVFLDVSENVVRMGYGQMEAIRALQAAGIVVRTIPGLRNGLVVVDGDGYSYTPTALLLEKDSGRDEVLNAMRLTAAQAAEAMARLSPASKALALVQATDESQKAAIEAFETETTPINVSAEALSSIEKRLTDAPPVQFELERQVRVFQPFFQYVELSLSGAAIQRHKVRIPGHLQGANISDETRRRLTTTFDLIDQNASISSKELDQELRQIRDDYTRSLGGKKGRIILNPNYS